MRRHNTVKCRWRGKRRPVIFEYMKRRRFVQTLFAAPVAPALLAQQPPAPVAPPSGDGESPKIEATPPDLAADTVPHFFNARQFATLRALSAMLMPSRDGVPGAAETGAPEFLDFLIGASGRERQQIYIQGLDALDDGARKRFDKSFADAGDQAAALLAPLREAWTYEPPDDPVARFLREAKRDVRTAVMNSRQHAATAAPTNRRAGGVGLYWYPIDPLV